MPSTLNQLNPEEEELRKLLLARIKVFRDRKWIDSTEENGFRSLLSSKKDEFIPSLKSLEAIEKRLETIKKEKMKEKSRARKDSKYNSKHDEDDGLEKDDYRFKVYSSQDIMNKLSDGTVDRLFTEMCVFAKLGFLQPPTCLHCAFRQSQVKDKAREKTKNKYCQNLVVWRRDTSERIYAENLDGNVVFVSCSSAQALMRDKTVQGLRWDKVSQQLIFSSQ